jgi:hypothetical protein
LAEHDRVVVHVDDPRIRGHGLGDLMGVVRGRDAGLDIEELADARLGHVPDRTAEEAPVGPHPGHNGGRGRHPRSAASLSAAKLSLPPSQKS